ncbi:PilZ domain-containing protein [Methylobacter sp. Wu8]|uniref:Cyclic diguanosine monophosphate-binding protein n=1 Tax=Methylobacter tundripaludum TaxID=173365 RepID=A0A2S6GXT9_9GAMM|nr:PilZ domain-containing protein [Methylobacter tundripaludum]MCK9637835.1 PilZ domain-containing protein [Methylobacter tundripaludum]PPK69981.1 PilZ domain-containing protein [Methylobacter tundripaludum]
MNPIENPDHRHFHRIHFAEEATLSSDDNTWSCEIIDLSLKGCLLRFDFPWEENPEKLYTLTLHLSEDAQIKMELTATHVVGNKVGFKCEHIDIDSISELRRLVELNLGNSALLERDLLALFE